MSVATLTGGARIAAFICIECVVVGDWTRLAGDFGDNGIVLRWMLHCRFTAALLSFLLRLLIFDCGVPVVRSLVGLGLRCGSV